MKKITILFGVNLLIYPLVIVGFLMREEENITRMMMQVNLLLIHSIFTYISYRIICFYKKNGEERIFAKNYYMLMVLEQVLMVLSPLVAKNYLPLHMLGSILIYMIMIGNQIMIGKKYIYYKGEVIDKSHLKKAAPNAKPVAYKGTILYQYKMKDKVKQLMIKEDYVPYLK